jgi:hypothetical protein
MIPMPLPKTMDLHPLTDPGRPRAAWRVLALRTVLVLAALPLMISQAQAQAQEQDPVRDAVQSITQRFMARAKACGQELPYTPGVVVDSRSTLISYFFADRSIHASR